MELDNEAAIYIYIYFNSINKYITIHPIIMQPQTKYIFCCSKKFPEYGFSAVRVVSSKPSVGP